MTMAKFNINNNFKIQLHSDNWSFIKLDIDIDIDIDTNHL